MTQDVKESGKVVLIVGGGDVAMDCARTARRLNVAEKVYSVLRTIMIPWLLQITKSKERWQRE